MRRKRSYVAIIFLTLIVLAVIVGIIALIIPVYALPEKAAAPDGQATSPTAAEAAVIAETKPGITLTENGE